MAKEKRKVPQQRYYQGIARRWYTDTCLYVLYRCFSAKPLRFERDAATVDRLNKMASWFLAVSLLISIDFSISMVKAIDNNRINIYVSALPEEQQLTYIANLPLGDLGKIRTRKG